MEKNNKGKIGRRIRRKREERGREENFRGECKMRTLGDTGNVEDKETRRIRGGLFIFRLGTVRYGKVE